MTKNMKIIKKKELKRYGNLKRKKEKKASRRERERTKENKSNPEEPFWEKNWFLSFWAWSRVTHMKNHAVSIKDREQRDEQNLLRNTQRWNSGVGYTKFSENSWVASKTKSWEQNNVQQHREPRQNHLHWFSKACAQKHQTLPYEKMIVV